MDLRRYVPATVSAEAAAILNMVGAAIQAMPRLAPPQTVEDFDQRAAHAAAFAEQIGAAKIAALAPAIERWNANGTPVLMVTPHNVREDASPLVYLHGGGFAQGSAQSSLLVAAVAAQASRRIVHSIDYTLTPRGTWRSILAEARSAWAGIGQRHPDKAIGLFGDSAGGCIAAALTLLLGQQDAPVPSALVLLSPLVDLAGEGDTVATLAAADFLDRANVEPALRAYADEAEWREPLVSPIHGDLSRFPPTLIQVGTRECLLSDSVRFHRALRAVKVASRLEVYEAMPHVFQSFLVDTPEGRSAWDEIAEFWSDYLV